MVEKHLCFNFLSKYNDFRPFFSDNIATFTKKTSFETIKGFKIHTYKI